MAKAPILVVLLPQLLYTLLEVSGQQSPCPEYFSYILNSATKEVMGQIQIPSPPKNVELHLKVALSIGVALPTSYVGQLKLAYSKEESVRLVETGPNATGQVVTSITLEHTLYPPSKLPFSEDSYPSYDLPEPNPGINYHSSDVLPSETTKQPPSIFVPVYSTTPRPPINVQYQTYPTYPTFEVTLTIRYVDLLPLHVREWRNPPLLLFNIRSSPLDERSDVDLKRNVEPALTF